LVLTTVKAIPTKFSMTATPRFFLLLHSWSYYSKW
jgi:hypothetical protein